MRLPASGWHSKNDGNMGTALKILIVGGYGTFGGRLVDLLKDENGLGLIVSGRSLERAQKFCAVRHDARAELVPAVFDREGDLAEQLRRLQPQIVVDASGPFQAYGAGRYNLIEACIALRINYLDLADGAEFVAGVAQFDSMARAAGVFVFSGVSSFPVLTIAAVKKLSEGMRKITAIRGGIAPSPFAGVGTNVLRAIAGYSGQPMPIRRNGGTVISYPLTESMRYTIAPPGYVPVRNLRFSLVDVPDLRALPALWPEVQEVWMGAGPVPEILHRALNFFAWLVRLKIVPTILPLAPLMEFVMRHISWGEHRGGMFIEVTGEDANGATLQRSWHLLAEREDGPMIPSMAAEAIIRKVLGGQNIELGARTPELTLEEYSQLFKNRAIYTGLSEDIPVTPAPLYKRHLGSAWETLPPEIRAMHDIESFATAEGTATITRGTSMLSRLACRIVRFPSAGQNVPLKVKFGVRGGIETWTRDFAGHIFSSRQYEGHGRSARLIVEKFGPLRFSMALVPQGDRLNLVLRRWSLFGVPLPMWLCVKTESYETAAAGYFHFNVRIWHPLTGLIVHYQGSLNLVSGGI